MDFAEFVDMVMPGIGEKCPVPGCTDWQDHLCTDYLGSADGHCIEHCICEKG